jgi:hypothetical protein
MAPLAKKGICPAWYIADQGPITNIRISGKSLGKEHWRGHGKVQLSSIRGALIQFPLSARGSTPSGITTVALSMLVRVTCEERSSNVADTGFPPTRKKLLDHHRLVDVRQRAAGERGPHHPADRATRASAECNLNQKPRLMPDRTIRQLDRYTFLRNATRALNMLREYANNVPFDARGFTVQVGGYSLDSVAMGHKLRLPCDAWRTLRLCKLIHRGIADLALDRFAVVHHRKCER